MNIFYSPDVSGSVHTLSESESKHAVQVLRMKSGDGALLFDGKGGMYHVEIKEPHPRKCELTILKTEFFPKRNFFIHIAIAPTKMNERFEWFLEKATEIGIDEITPLICNRSERRQINYERFEKVLIAAMKQCKNTWLPKLNEQISFEDFLKANSPGFIAHCLETEKVQLKEIDKNLKQFTILIGPEGDFTENEIATSIHSGWTPVSLGNSRLRTETAGIVGCHTINLMKG